MHSINSQPLLFISCHISRSIACAYVLYDSLFAVFLLCDILRAVSFTGRSSPRPTIVTALCYSYNRPRPFYVLRYYGNGGMGGGGGLQATDLRRRLEFQCTGGTCSQGLRSLRHDSYHVTEEKAACDDHEDR